MQLSRERVTKGSNEKAKQLLPKHHWITKMKCGICNGNLEKYMSMLADEIFIWCHIS